MFIRVIEIEVFRHQLFPGDFAAEEKHLPPGFNFFEFPDIGDDRERGFHGAAQRIGARPDRKFLPAGPQARPSAFPLHRLEYLRFRLPAQGDEFVSEEPGCLPVAFAPHRTFRDFPAELLQVSDTALSELIRIHPSLSFPPARPGRPFNFVVPTPSTNPPLTCFFNIQQPTRNIQFPSSGSRDLPELKNQAVSLSVFYPQGVTTGEKTGDHCTPAIAGEK